MIRRAVPEDVSAITAMIYELAEHQRARDECTVTADQIDDALFGEFVDHRGDRGDVLGYCASDHRAPSVVTLWLITCCAPCSKPRTEYAPGDIANRRPSLMGSSAQRAMSAREK